MPDYFVDAFVEKLVLLEQKTGASVHYRVMPPISTPFNDHLAIQATAKKIAEFIGLTGFTFIIATAKQKKKVGGHIDLSTGGKEVFIEVDSDMMQFPNAVAATLCHETCHKWLQVNGINSPIEYDNEILTDITAVYLGFGKIMLNGCVNTKVSYQTANNKTQTITKSLNVGYLERDQLAFVYSLVCAMRKIPSSDLSKDLNVEAAFSIERCNRLYGSYFSSRFHRKDTTQETITDFESQVVKVQRLLADLDKHVTFIKNSFCETVGDFLSAAHRKLETFRQKAVATAEYNEPDPALCFLRAIQQELEIKRLNDKVHTMSQETGELLRHARVFGSNINRNNRHFPTPSPKIFSAVTCPQDGTRLRLPENSGDLIATCPTCKYRFAYNTSAVIFLESSGPLKLTWWEKLRNLLVGEGNRRR